MSASRIVAVAIALLAGAALAQEPSAQPPPSGTVPPASPTPPPESPPPQSPPSPGAEEVVAPPGGAPAGAAPGDTTEEIIVTGSRIRRKDLNTPAPVTVISSQQLAQSGRITVGDFLQALPEQGNALNTQVNNGGSGATRVDLRGLGNVRTLVLVNGRRMVYTGIGLDSGTGVDLNTIPTAAVERIEILKDGASAVYGSDAIAGVVNVITKKKFDGTEVGAFGGTSYRGDGTTWDLSATTGASSDRGSILFSVGFFEQNQVWAGDRRFSDVQRAKDFTTGQVIPFGSSRVPNGRVDDDGAGGGNAQWDALVAADTEEVGSYIFDPTLTAPATAGNPQGIAGWWRPFNFGGSGPAGDLYNFQPVNYLITPNQRISLYSTGSANFGERVRGFFEASYVARESSQQLAPEPLIVGSGGADVIISRDSIYNPFGRDFSSYAKRLLEFGARRQTQNVDTFRVVTGVDGSLPEGLPGPLGGWNWDVSLNYGRTTYTGVNRGNLIVSQLQAAIGPSFLTGPGPDGLPGTADDGATCGTEAAPIRGCVPLDLFHGAGAITPAMIDPLSFTAVSRITNQLTAFQANVSGGLFPLLGDRPVSLAVGYELRRESGSDVPDPVTQKGLSTGNNRQETSGAYTVHEGYAELSLPIISGATFVEDLEATAAARVFNYTTFGTDWTYKLGARWQVVPDATVRGTYSTAFRAPSITELFLGASDNFPSLRDPCRDLAGASAQLVANCTAAGVPAAGSGDSSTQLRSQNGGNVDLDPETAEIFTIGLVLTPRWVRDLSLTVDYYNIRVEELINTYGAAFIVGQCYANDRPGDPFFCGLVQRTPGTGRITRILDLNQNLQSDETSGVDVGLRYALGSPVGRFALALDGTWLIDYDRTLPDGTKVRGQGTFDLGQLNNGGTGGIFPRFKALAGVTWTLDTLALGTTLRYVGSFKECADSDGTSFGGVCYDNPTGLSRTVASNYTWDVFASYGLRSPFGDTSLGVGVRNLFNQAPPTIYNSFTPNSDPTGYDFTGRFFYASLTQRF